MWKDRARGPGSYSAAGFTVSHLMQLTQSPARIPRCVRRPAPFIVRCRKPTQSRTAAPGSPRGPGRGNRLYIMHAEQGVLGAEPGDKVVTAPVTGYK